jgi:NAD(P)-dependent dehydrogenase (short-subunit alcohol dehydrogenase family)
MNIDGSIAFVTGANRGLGAALTEALLERGTTKVYGGVRRPETITDPRITPIRLDLTDRPPSSTLPASPRMSLC